MRFAGLILAGVGGLLFGSFANVVVWRVPRRESIVRPPSHCPNCNAQLRWYENVPVLSWVAQGARCRHCGVHVSARYPAVELVTGALFVLAAAILPRSRDLVAYLPLFWVLVVLSFVDLDHKILPNRIVLPSIAAGVALFGLSAALGPGVESWVRALEGGAAAFGAFFVIALIAPAGMGMGDVKLSALLGMALGYLSWSRVYIGLMAGFFAGAIGGVILIATRRGGMKTQVPFGPYLAFGTVVGILWGGWIARVWLGR